MRFIIKKIKLACLILTTLSIFSGCNTLDYNFPYENAMALTSFQKIESASLIKAQAFATNLCIATNENIMLESVDMSQANGAGFFDLNEQETLYAKNVHEQFQIASLTKIMTAYVALKYGTLDQTLTATNSIIITDSGAQLCGLEVGDSMTLDQALHLLLMYSANDAAMLIANGVGGSVENFVDLMNKEAVNLGATNTQFKNPSGLTEDGQYSSVYDQYLIFNEALNFERFKEIISMQTYTTSYTDNNGETKDISILTTNRYLRNEVDPPSGMSILGGKTGTTNAAGHCLLIFSRDKVGNPYISIVLGATSRDELYIQMNDLLDEIE